MENNSKIKCLVLDGGGEKGYIECALLVKLEQDTGKKCCELFQFISGTSIGGILSCLLSIGVPASECLKFFTDDGVDIFKKKWYKLINIKPKYSAESIENVLEQRLKDSTLKDCKTKLLVPAVDIITGSPFFFKSYSGDNYLLRDCARATSAAPTFFPLHPLDGMILTDGGLCQNNPSLCIWTDLHKMGYKDENIKILSLGCGTYTKKINWNKYINGRILDMLILIFSLLFESGSEEVDYQMKNILGDNYCRINPELSMNLTIDGVSEKDIRNLNFCALKNIRENYPKLLNFVKSN